MAINYLGLPAGVIGTGIVEDRPAAVQIVGQRYREDLICDALEALQERCADSSISFGRKKSSNH